MTTALTATALLLSARVNAQTHQPAPARQPLIGTLGREGAQALQTPAQSPDNRLHTASNAPPSAEDTRRIPAPPIDGRVIDGRVIDRRPIDGRRLGGGGVWYRVPDAPVYSRGGSTLLIQPLSPEVVSTQELYPTSQPPVWRIVPDDHPVQAWRTIDVDDVLCNASGQCSAVTTRMVARWVASLRGYAFADRLGRVWLVE